MNFILLFKFIFLSHLKQQKMSIAFAVISIILGVSIFVTIHLTSTNILNSFKSTTNYLSEQNEFFITSTTPIQETIIPELLKLPSIDRLLPVSMHFVQAYSNEKNMGYVQIIGVDFLGLNQVISLSSTLKNFNASNLIPFLQDKPVNAIVSRKLLEKMGNSQFNLLINGIEKPIKVQAILDKSTMWGDEVIIVDIKNYQNLFNSYFVVDKLYLSFNTPDLKKAITDIRRALPPPLTLTKGNDNSQYVENVTSTYQFNLNFLTCLALLVTAIILYNAISHYVLERRKDFGILLMLGAKPNHLFLFTLFTTVFLAFFCSLGGLGVGYLITSLTLKYIVQSFSQLFLSVNIEAVSVPWTLVVEVFTSVFIIALLVSIFPCLEAYRSSALQTTFYQTYEQDFQKKQGLFSIIGTLIIIFSLLSMLPPILKWNPSLVYLSLSGILLGTAFFLPKELAYLLLFLKKIIPGHWIEARMAIDHIKTTARKNTVAIAAMSISISLYLSCMIIIDSDRYTCINWVNNMLSADVYLNAKPSTLTFRGGYINNDMVQFISNSPDIAAVNFLTHKDSVFNNKPLRIIGMNYPVIGTYYKLPFIKAMSQNELQSILANPNNVFISEPFAREFNYHIGDIISLPSQHGLINLKIANVFYNYVNFQNIVLIPNPLFMELYDNPPIESALLYLKQPDAYSSFLDGFIKAFPDINIPIYNQTQIKYIGISMMEQTFKISQAIVLTIFALTALTLFNLLEQLILSRKHEFRIFWAIGIKDLALVKMCLWESFIIYIAALLAAIIPTIIGLILIFNYLIQFLFNVHLDLSLSYYSIFSFILLLLVLVIIDGLLPAVKIKKFINAEGLQRA